MITPGYFLLFVSFPSDVVRVRRTRLTDPETTARRYFIRYREDRPRNRPRDLDGPDPQPAWHSFTERRDDGLGFEFRTAKNPNRPQIDPKSRAVADAVVFLRGIDPASVGPWDLPRGSRRDRGCADRRRAG